MSFLILLQHEQFYREGLLCLLGWMKLEPKVNDFTTAIFKAFQGLEFLF